MGSKIRVGPDGTAKRRKGKPGGSVERDGPGAARRRPQELRLHRREQLLTGERLQSPRRSSCQPGDRTRPM